MTSGMAISATTAHDINDTLVGDVRLGFMGGKQFGGDLDPLLLVGHLPGALCNSLGVLAWGGDGWVA